MTVFARIRWINPVLAPLAADIPMHCPVHVADVLHGPPGGPTTLQALVMHDGFCAPADFVATVESLTDDEGDITAGKALLAVCDAFAAGLPRASVELLALGGYAALSRAVRAVRRRNLRP